MSTNQGVSKLGQIKIDIYKVYRKEFDILTNHHISKSQVVFCH